MLSDEQIDMAHVKFAWVNLNCIEHRDAFARAIESAATAPLLARIAELERELEEARKDAERYLWLKQDRPVLMLTGFFGNGCVNRTIDEVDTAIDAAIRAAIKEQT